MVHRLRSLLCRHCDVKPEDVWGKETGMLYVILLHFCLCDISLPLGMNLVLCTALYWAELYCIRINVMHLSCSLFFLSFLSLSLLFSVVWLCFWFGIVYRSCLKHPQVWEHFSVHCFYLIKFRHPEFVIQTTRCLEACKEPSWQQSTVYVQSSDGVWL